MALIGLLLAGRFLYLAFASDETRIRWKIERMADGFNDTRSNPCMEGLAKEYVDSPSGADRELVHQALVHLFFTAKDPETKKFLYRVEIPEEEVKTSVADGEPDTATLDALARFHEVRGDMHTLAWEIRFQGDLVEGEDGWQFVRTRHETLAGARLK